MPPKVVRDLNREHEVLDKPVNPTGTGEDPAVRAMLDEEFVDKPDSETLDIRLAVQEIIRGQASMLAQIASGNEAMADQLRNIRGRMETFEKGQREAEEERTKLLQTVTAMGERLKMSEAKRGQLQAEATEALSRESLMARADIQGKRRRLEAKLTEEPKEMVMWPVQGVEMIRVGQSMEAVMVPATVRIGHLTFCFPAGSSVTVPQSVASAIRNLAESTKETRARQSLIDASGGVKGDEKQDVAISQGWENIGSQFRSPASRIPIASR